MDPREQVWLDLLNSIEKYGGETVRKVVEWHLMHAFGITKENYLDDPKKLIQALKEIYGEAFAVIEKDWCESMSSLNLRCDKGILNALESLKLI